MNAEQLKSSIQYFMDRQNELGVSVYVILKDSEDPAPLRIDIEDDAAFGIIELYLQSSKALILDKEELEILNLSTADSRSDVIYRYDLDELPQGTSAIEVIIGSDSIPFLNLAEVHLSNVKALLIEIGDNESQLIFYKTMMPVNIFKQSSFFLKKSAHRMEKINDEFLRLSSSFQLLKIEGELMILDLEALERSFGFKEVILKEAEAGVQAIEDLELVENPELLRELLSDIRYARRFTRVAKGSPVIKFGIPNERIIEFCRSYPSLAGRIRFNESKEKIELDTNVSKELFIKILMDDFLTSELTKLHYMSVAKDNVED